MGILDDVMGGSGKAGVQDFINRFQQGSPHEGYDDDEAAEQYSRITPNLTDTEYRESAAATFEKLNPEERAEFGRWLQERARTQGVSTPALDDADDMRLRDPGQLAEATTQIRQQDPNILQQLLGKGGTGGPFDNPIAKVAAAGIAAFAAQRILGGRG